MLHRVKKVEYLNEYKLKIQFNVGKSKEVDLVGMLKNAKNMFLQLKVSRSSYYGPQGLSKRSLENQEIVKKAREAYHKSRGTYGSPRIHAALCRLGVKCSRARVARLMKKADLQAKMTKAWKRTTKRKEGAIAAPNHLDQQFNVKEPNKVWVSDITFVPTEEGWLYVSVSLDLFSRKVVGLSIGASLETSLVLKTLNQALIHRDPE